MGNWHISIEGTGQHHNSGDPKDAEVQAQKFVEELQASGQHVEHATFTSGGRMQLMKPETPTT